MPINSFKITNIHKLQIIQNKALRFIYNIRGTDLVRNTDLHRHAELPLIQDLLKERAKDIWGKVEEIDPPYNIPINFNEMAGREHAWFRSSKERTNN